MLTRPANTPHQQPTSHHFRAQPDQGPTVDQYRRDYRLWLRHGYRHATTASLVQAGELTRLPTPQCWHRWLPDGASRARPRHLPTASTVVCAISARSHWVTHQAACRHQPRRCCHWYRAYEALWRFAGRPRPHQGLQFEARRDLTELVWINLAPPTTLWRCAITAKDTQNCRCCRSNCRTKHGPSEHGEHMIRLLPKNRVVVRPYHATLTPHCSGL